MIAPQAAVLKPFNRLVTEDLKQQQRPVRTTCAPRLGIIHHDESFESRESGTVESNEPQVNSRTICHSRLKLLARTPAVAPQSQSLSTHMHKKCPQKRSRKPNPKYLAQDDDATNAGPPASRKNAPRRKRKVARLSAREDARSADVQGYIAKWYNPAVCGIRVEESLTRVIETPPQESIAKRHRAALEEIASTFSAFCDAIEELEGKDVWERPTPSTWDDPQPMALQHPQHPQQAQAQAPMQTQTPPQEPPETNSMQRTRNTTSGSKRKPTSQPRKEVTCKRRAGRNNGSRPAGCVATGSKRRATNQPRKEGTCQRTAGCDKGLRHTGFCRAHKINSRENRLRRIQANNRGAKEARARTP